MCSALLYGRSSLTGSALRIVARRFPSEARDASVDASENDFTRHATRALKLEEAYRTIVAFKSDASLAEHIVR